MVFQVVRTAEPANMQRQAVIVMVRLDGQGAAYLARLLRDLATANVDVQVSSGVALTPLFHR